MHEECAPSIIRGVLLNLTGAEKNDRLGDICRVARGAEGTRGAGRGIIHRRRGLKRL
ncbi:hypothetical protein NLX83_40705 [Allokutzneria sp. A3M-2-11 16]|uniref:hypothetical protein n=1 Tax=Allokutzneria sp. A3M-2-11 16 TaxID=2962043 RepID=UPI0020B75BCC|nr:hypothetical protein [Allokutzneria sp. A3M-2-11 16]MCP3805603.1 hypothetical protein [Allokutzneria sp. A3M-2-11 16]